MIDSSIYSQIKPFTMSDPVQQAGQMYQLQHAALQGELGRRSLQDQDTYKQAARDSGGDPTKLMQNLFASGHPDAIKVQQQLLQQKKLELETGALKAKQLGNAAMGLDAAFQQALQASGGDPQKARALVQPMFLQHSQELGIQNPGEFDPIENRRHIAGAEGAAKYFETQLSKFGQPHTVMIDGKPTLAQFDQNGQMKPVQGAAPTPNTQVVNLGGSSRVIDKNAVTPGTEFKHSMTPGETASNALGYARLGEDKRHHGVTETQGNLSQPFEVTAPDNTQKLVQQDKRTGQLVDVNTKQPVTGVAPKQDAATETALRASRQLTYSVDSLIKQFKPEYVGIRGHAGEATDQYASQIPGLSGLADPDRVTFRQQSSSVTNDYIHQITGATVGQGGEQQRLMRAVPQVGDSAPVYAAKLKQMKKNLEELPRIIANNPNLNGQTVARPDAPAPAAPTREQIDAELKRRGVLK